MAIMGKTVAHTASGDAALPCTAFALHVESKHHATWHPLSRSATGHAERERETDRERARERERERERKR